MTRDGSPSDPLATRAYDGEPPEQEPPLRLARLLFVVVAVALLLAVVAVVVAVAGS